SRTEAMTRARASHDPLARGSCDARARVIASVRLAAGRSPRMRTALDGHARAGHSNERLAAPPARASQRLAARRRRRLREDGRAELREERADLHTPQRLG